MHSPVVFDTSVIISRPHLKLPPNFSLSAVVAAELGSSALNEPIRQWLDETRLRHERQGTLIVPTSEDWLLASRVLGWLTQRRKKSAGGKLPPQKPGASQQMMPNSMDALIAVSARRTGALVVTEDYDDFKAIQYYCQFRLKRGSDYLKADR